MPGREQAVLPATLDAHAEALLMLRAGRGPDERFALRLWPAPMQLDDGTPLWIGTAQTLRLSRPLDAVALWLPVPEDRAARTAVLIALDSFDPMESPHPRDPGVPVMRLRIDEAPVRDASGQ